MIAIPEQESIVLEMAICAARKLFLRFGIIATALAALFAIAVWILQGPRYKGRTVEGWVSQIDPARATDPEVVSALEYFGSNAVPHLVELLAHGDPPEWRRKLWRLVQRHRRLNPWTAAARQQAQVVEAFGILGPKAESAIAHLAPFLLNHNTSDSAGWALVVIGPKTNLLPTLKAGLTNPSPTVRRNCAAVLSYSRPPPGEAAELIAGMLKDPDFAIRFQAVRRSGGLTGDVSAVALPLAERLNDPDARVRQEARAALAKLGHRASNAAPRVLEILPTKSATERILIETLVLPNLGVKHKATFAPGPEPNNQSEPKNPYE
jgi:HEAT repeat protein